MNAKNALARKGAAAIAIAGMMLALGGFATLAEGTARDPMLIVVTGPVAPAKGPESLTPEQKMQRRYPQAVKVGDLIGLPILDDDDRTLGRVKSVVRNEGGKIQLIIPYGGFLGFRQRLVAIPIEVVAIAGRQIAALDMTRAEIDVAPAWSDPASQPIAASEIIRIGLYRR
jgi:hypothetical protein